LLLHIHHESLKYKNIKNQTNKQKKNQHKDFLIQYIDHNMKTYLQIIQLHANAKNIEYPNETYALDKSPFWENIPNEKSQTLNNLYFFMDKIYKLYINKGILFALQEKHKKIHEFRQGFLAQTRKEELEILYKSQKTYFAFIKLAQIYRHAKTPHISTDLLLNPIPPKNRNTIKVYEQNKLYLFTCYDLYNHIESCLSNCDVFYYVCPNKIKNPYSNTPFTKAALAYIYFKLKEKSIKFPQLFHKYFLCCFDTNKFQIEYEYDIKDAHIKRAVNKSNTTLLFESMKYMLKMLTKKRLKVQEHIDKEEFVKILRPYYYLHLMGHYHIRGLEKTNNALQLLRVKIHELEEFNPSFGRVYLKRIPIHPKKFRYMSDLDHPKFTMEDVLTLERRTLIGRSMIDDDDTEDEEAEFSD